MAAGNAPILQMQQALEDKENQINAMQEQMNQMNQRIADLAVKPKKVAVAE
jgi:cell division protein FtsL